jgi:hypothetical protein
MLCILSDEDDVLQVFASANDFASLGLVVYEPIENSSLSDAGNDIPSPSQACDSITLPPEASSFAITFSEAGGDITLPSESGRGIISPSEAGGGTTSSSEAGDGSISPPEAGGVITSLRGNSGVGDSATPAGSNKRSNYRPTEKPNKVCTRL